MPDSSSITQSRKGSALAKGALAARAMGGSKPNSTVGATQFRSHREGAPIVRASNVTAETIVASIPFTDSTTYFSALKSYLRTAPPQLVPITNTSLVSYYNNLIGSEVSIDSGETIFAVAGTTIGPETFNNLDDEVLILLPDYPIMIDGISVSIVNGQISIGGAAPIPSGIPIQISPNLPCMDFLVSGSPGLFSKAKRFNLDHPALSTYDFTILKPGFFRPLRRFYFIDTEKFRNGNPSITFYPPINANTYFPSALTWKRNIISFKFTLRNANNIVRTPPNLSFPILYFRIRTNDKLINTTKSAWQLVDSSNNVVVSNSSANVYGYYYTGFNPGSRDIVVMVPYITGGFNNTPTINLLRNNVPYSLNLKIVPQNVTDKITIEGLSVELDELP